MDYMPTVIAGISLVLGVGGAGAIVVLFAKSNFAKATIDALRGDISDRDKRLDERDERIADLEKGNEELSVRLERQGREIEILKDLLTGREEQMMHEERAATRHTQMQDELRVIADQFRSLIRVMVEVRNAMRTADSDDN